MLKATSTNLTKLETLFSEIGYKIIYEKGHFTSGYCIVNERKTIVINRFYKTEARFNCLITVLNEIDLQQNLLTENSLLFYQKIS